MREIDTVHILSNRILRDRNTIQYITVFHNNGYGLLIHIIGDDSGNIFLIAVGTHGISDIDHLQQIFLAVTEAGHKTLLIVWICIISNGIAGSTGQIVDHIVRCRRLFSIIQFIDRIPAVYICQKT